MIRKMTALVAAMTLTAVGVADAQAPAAAPKPAKDWQIPDRAEIRNILTQRIDDQHQALSIVVETLNAGGAEIVTHGWRADTDSDKRPLDGRSMFEIGSMSKVFTSLLLAEMVDRGEVKLDEPVAKYLPPGTKVPERGGRQITLIDLATHTSGLPRLPTNMAPKDRANPYADYTAEQLYQFLAGYALPRDIGSKYEYSNLGGGLLGLALSRRAGMSYEALLKQRVLGPLGLRSTTITLAPDEKARLVTGHDANLKPVENWDFQDATAGAGALRSDADDMVKFLAAELGFGGAQLQRPMLMQLKPRRPTDIPNTEIALGWHITTTPRGPIVWHNGGTGGYRTIMAFDPDRRVGVVVLADTETPAGVDDIAFHILAGTPLIQPPAPPVAHHEIPVDVEVMQNLVGHYQLAPQVIAEVTVQDGQLFIQLTGQAKAPVFFEGPNRVFWKVVDAQARFEVDGEGHGAAMVLHQAGRDFRAPRLKDELAPGR